MQDELYVTPDDEPHYYEKGTQEYNDWKRGCLDEYNGDFNVYKLYKEELKTVT